MIWPPSRQGVLQSVRLVKHAGLVALRKSQGALERAQDAILQRWDHVWPYRFDPSNYPLSFIRLPAPDSPASVSSLPRTIYSFWTGTNALTEARQRGLDSLRKMNPDLEVHLVTNATLEDILVSEHPLHRAYENLSLVHRADYLRAYVMHFHGGGYADIKTCLRPWGPVFDALDLDSDIWLAGYPEAGHRHAAWMDDRLGRDVRLHFGSLVGMASLVVRPRTPLTQMWLEEVERRLNYYEPLLAAHPGNTWGDNPGYPIPWTGIMSQVLQPLQLRFLEHVFQHDALRPVLEGHR